MKRLVSIFLSLMILLCCVVPVSATGFDPNTNGYSFDALPYLESAYIDTSNLSVGSSRDFYISLPSVTDVSYVSGVFETIDTNPILKSSRFGDFTVTPLGNSLFSFYGTLGFGHPITYTKGSNSSYILFLSLDITPVDYLRNDLDIKVNFQGSYEYRQYYDPFSDIPFKDISTSFNVVDDVVIGANVYAPILRENILYTSTPPEYAYNEQSVFLTTFLYFDWTPYDRVDLLLYNDFDDLRDYVFFVDGVNVVRNVYPSTINEDQAVMISLDFSDLDPNVNSHICYLRFRGERTLDSQSGNRLFQVTRVSCFIRTVSDNFWPLWLNKIIDKLDNIFTGRGQDQTAADSFNDSVADQSNELEDLTADLNAVTRPPLSDVNLSTSTMVDSGTIVLATSGLGSILSNSIILRVLLMALTFALAGFILFGKR